MAARCDRRRVPQRAAGYKKLMSGWSFHHTDYLASKGVFKLSEKKSNFIAMWSCRFWAAYVFL